MESLVNSDQEFLNCFALIIILKLVLRNYRELKLILHNYYLFIKAFFSISFKILIFASHFVDFSKQHLSIDLEAEVDIGPSHYTLLGNLLSEEL